MKTSHFISIFSLCTIVFLSTAFAPIVLKDNEETTEFKAFLSHFNSTDLPYNITLSDTKNFITKAQYSAQSNLTEKAIEKEKRLQKIKKERSDAISNPTFLPEAFQSSMSRLGPPIFEPMAQFELNDDMIGVVYSSSIRFGFYSKSYKMMIYNKKGDILNMDIPDNEDKLKISRYLGNNGFLVGHTSVQTSMTCKIDAQGHIWQNTYKHKWAKNMNRCPIEKNTLVDSKLVETKVFQVTKDGKIEEMKEYPTVAKASLK